MQNIATKKSSNKIVIGDKSFNKTQCTQFFRTMLNSYGINEYLNLSDFECLRELLEYHTESGEKIGCGVKSFQIVSEPVYGGRRFDIVRNDGTRCDFSYIKCISKPRDPHFREVMMAMRTEILPQILAFKSELYGTSKYVRCAITNLNVQKKDCHVDHKFPKTFQVLVFDFLKSQNLILEKIVVEDADHLGLHSVRYLSDPELKSAWQEYHFKNADLRITLDHANLGQPKNIVDFSLLEDCVLQADPSTESTKSKKAVKMGVTVIGESELTKLIQG